MGQKPSGLYPVLDEFAHLTLSDTSEEELDLEEEEEVEEVAAEYEQGRTKTILFGCRKDNLECYAMKTFIIVLSLMAIGTIIAKKMTLWAVTRTWPILMPVHANSSALPVIFSTSCDMDVPCMIPIGGVFLCLWLLYRLQARQARDKAVIVQALAAIYQGVSPQKANGLCTPIGLVALALGKALVANGFCTPIGFVALALGKALASFPSGTTVLDRLDHHEVLT
ncbi:hypothetical protein U0070_012280 [Myodes glareolus]|uniref:Uncharacterized protein n=1 Tax=Myodes glareolus TaxID=447135 RepID=A0AAW0JF61_MYOGA